MTTTSSYYNGRFFFVVKSTIPGLYCWVRVEVAINDNMKSLTLIAFVDDMCVEEEEGEEV